MGIIKKVIEKNMFFIPLSHRERGNEGERPVNQNYSGLLRLTAIPLPPSPGREGGI
jgi:hypothetical protein